MLVSTEGHPVCAMMPCEAVRPCYLLTIIKDCGVPAPTIRSFETAFVYIIAIPAALLAAMFAFRKYYLQRKDFYVMR
jgi:hypothetical protein